MEYLTEELAADIVKLAEKINEAGLSAGISLTAKKLTPFPSDFAIESSCVIRRDVGNVCISVSVLPF